MQVIQEMEKGNIVISAGNLYALRQIVLKYNLFRMQALKS